MIENWERVQTLFLKAMDLRPEERAAFLETACAGDEELRREIARLEAEIGALELDRESLQLQLDEIERKINESAVRDYNAELLQRTLRDFRSAFTALTPPEQSEALQCVLKGVTVHRQKLALEIFELEEFHPSSQNRKDWLPGLDSN